MSSEERQALYKTEGQPVTPGRSICPCHNAEIVFLLDPVTRKPVPCWLRDKDGNVQWDGNSVYMKGIHQRHNSHFFWKIKKANLKKASVSAILDKIG